MLDAIREKLQPLADALMGVHRWIMRYRWLRGGVHHATLMGLLMAALLPFGMDVWPAAVGLGLYGGSWLSKDTDDNWTDVAIPAGFVALWFFAGPLEAVLALLIVAGLLLVRDLWTLKGERT